MFFVSSSQTECFIIRPRLQQFFTCSRQSINRYYSAWHTTYQDSIFYVSIFLADGKREGEERERETPSSLHYYFLFFEVGCTAMFYSTQGSVQPQENWRELYKNLTVLSSQLIPTLDPDSIERINVFPTSLET